MLLAFDTSTAAVTAALHDGRRVVAERTVVDPLRHAELLAPTIAAMLDDTQADRTTITAIVAGVGPGPFTGLRVGVMTARALGTALGVPVHGVCSLDVVAAGVDLHEVSGPFAVATDARRREVYWASYDATGRRVSDPTVGRPVDLALDVTVDLPVAGRGAVLYPEAFPRAVRPEYPSAADLARAVATGDAVLLAPDPLYLRRPDVRPPGARKPVLAP